MGPDARDTVESWDQNDQSAGMAHALYGTYAGERTELQRLPPPISIARPPSEPILVPRVASNGNWPEEALFLLGSGGNELGHKIPHSGLFNICVDGSPGRSSVIAAVSGVEENGFSELQQAAATFGRSISSQSLGRLSSSLFQQGISSFHPCLCSSAAAPALETEFSGVRTGTSFMREVFSAGDLQKLCLDQESGTPEREVFCNGVPKAVRYNPEEKRERIQRYRSKRNQRNFTKKITYACRKTLADSRPRVRGRFAKNEDQGENSTQVHWNQMEDDEDEESWIHLFDVN